MFSDALGVLDLFVRGSFFLLLFVYVIVGLILWYHWTQYASSARIATLTLTVYVIGGLSCLALMLPAIIIAL